MGKMSIVKMHKDKLFFRTKLYKVHKPPGRALSLGEGLGVLGVLRAEYFLPILAVREHPLAWQVEAVSLVPRGGTLDATLQVVATIGGADLACNQIHCCVCHSKYLTFSFCIYYITK